MKMVMKGQAKSLFEVKIQMQVCTWQKCPKLEEWQNSGKKYETFWNVDMVIAPYIIK